MRFQVTVLALLVVAMFFLLGCTPPEADIQRAEAKLAELEAAHAAMTEGPDKVALGLLINELRANVARWREGVPWWHLVLAWLGLTTGQAVGVHRPIRKILPEWFRNPEE